MGPEAPKSYPLRTTPKTSRRSHTEHLNGNDNRIHGVNSLSFVNALEPLDAFIVNRKATKGLTVKGETWLRETLGKFLLWLPVPITEVNIDTIISFLSQYEDKPWRKRSFYLALRTFWKWMSLNRDLPNPFLDKYGNAAIDPPKTPSRILRTQTPDVVQQLMLAAPTLRDKTILSLLADSGGRRGEVAYIQVADVDLERYRIKVLGKGNKEGYLPFGLSTKALLVQYLEESSPKGSLFGLNHWGLKSMLQRLEKKTGIRCNAHSFRRGFATELRKKGLGE